MSAPVALIDAFLITYRKRKHWNFKITDTEVFAQ